MSTNHRPVRPIRKVKRASPSPERPDQKVPWSIVILIGICLLACWIGYSYFKFVGDQWAKENWSHPVTYTMPASAQIIDQYTSEADPFGDFTYCASFRLSDPELDILLSKGFAWIQAESWGIPTLGLPSWQTGQIPHDIPSHACNNIKPWLDEAKIYRYLFDRGGRIDRMRLLAIDEKEKIIFYYRDSW